MRASGWPSESSHEWRRDEPYVFGGDGGYEFSPDAAGRLLAAMFPTRYEWILCKLEGLAYRVGLTGVGVRLDRRQRRLQSDRARCGRWDGRKSWSRGHV